MFITNKMIVYWKSNEIEIENDDDDDIDMNQ